ncbi:MAG: SDR family NAD(P)-dependent oxidoreductase [Roseitalea sp.]|jgi:NAD(P)-dependent dehydrogenase (short-subunit alcohol dehydrogenase family)|nr:SDR family NAD(P)-dependent oxidoreductase [Roseitalea sp.]MBO6720671.1 SDR family NAD(P)-dependent oxidoreductase [Roseitalea sp.]MBO6743818.1 SDR family NAD(P)-dependent oxidoreductase [Roseitalea sp.]
MARQMGRLEVADRVVMMSGGSTGIGKAIAQRLVDDGYRLSLGGRRPDEMMALYAPFGDRVLISRFEATIPDDAGKWVDRTLRAFGGIDVLINNAGINKPLNFTEGDETIMDELWDVNVKAPFRLMRFCMPHLSQCGFGRIVNIASTDAKRYRDGSVSVAYCATKHALLSLSHAAKFAGWETGVRVTALCPGAVDTDFIGDAPGATPKALRIAPETIAEAVAFLLGMPNNAVVAEMVVNSRLESSL